MVKLVTRQDIFVETVSKRDGSLYLKRVQRRAVCVGVNLYEFRYNHQICYARMTSGRLVCDARTLWLSHPIERRAA